MDRRSIALLILVVVSTGSSASGAEVPDFNTHVLPIFRKYCNGCHNATEIEGGLVLENFSHTMKGGEAGPAIVAGDSNKSRLWRLVSGLDDPKMPPKDQTAPKPDELAIIKAWIDAGAKHRLAGWRRWVSPRLRSNCGQRFASPSRQLQWPSMDAGLLDPSLM